VISLVQKGRDYSEEDQGMKERGASPRRFQARGASPRRVQAGGASPRRFQAGGESPRRFQERGTAPRREIPFVIDVKGGEIVTLM
jgi:hypothetical protein